MDITFLSIKMTNKQGLCYHLIKARFLSMDKYRKRHRNVVEQVITPHVNDDTVIVITKPPAPQLEISITRNALYPNDNSFNT